MNENALRNELKRLSNTIGYVAMLRRMTDTGHIKRGTLRDFCEERKQTHTHKTTDGILSALRQVIAGLSLQEADRFEEAA